MTTINYLTPKRQPKLLFENVKYPANAGNYALNFVNTGITGGIVNHDDQLVSFEAFLHWCYKTGVISNDYYLELDLEGYSSVNETLPVFQKIKDAQFVLHDIFLAVINGKPADEWCMHHFNTLLQTAEKHFIYESTADGVQRVWHNYKDNMYMPLWLIMQTAAELLLSDKAKMIGRCPCGSLFIDQTKNKIRKWCSPSGCGAIFRAERYYQRKKKRVSDIPVGRD